MKKTQWEHLRRNHFATLVEQDAVVIIPVASIEQHGEHLPINTDANNCHAVATRAAESIDRFPVLVLPVVWPGYSPHHMVHPGTITLKFDTFLHVLTEIAVCVHTHGFRKILFLNGHGGNSAIISSLRLKLTAEHEISVVGYTYWDLPGVAAEWRSICETDKGFAGHAAEVETSLQLYLQPDLVDMKEARWVPGVYGDPTYATRDKGERLLNAAVSGLIETINDLHSGVLDKRLEWGIEVPIE